MILLKGAFPFRLGCTSYVIPDTIIPNVEFMADSVDDIELVLFESKEVSPSLDRATISELRLIGNRANITYSIHFPIDVKVGSSDTLEQDRLLECITTIIHSTISLPVSGYILHFEGITSLSDTDEQRTWHSRVNDFCIRLTSMPIVAPSQICIENLDYPPEFYADIVKKYDFTNCIDVGHLWLQHEKWKSYVNKLLPMTRIIHLHGINRDSKDHQSLAVHTDMDQLSWFISQLRTYTGVLTFEVFSKHAVGESFSTFEEIWQKLYW